MDRVAQRYADPFAFMGAYLQVGRFGECVNNIIEAINRDAKDKADEMMDERLWSLWLHRYQGNLPYGEWKETILHGPEQHEKPKEVEPGEMAGNLDIAMDTIKKLRQSAERR